VVKTVTVPGANPGKGNLCVETMFLQHTLRALVFFYSSLHLAGWSFCGKLTASDILVTPCGSFRVLRSKLKSLKQANKRKIRKDFRSAFRLLKSLFRGVPQMPREFRHLLKLMKNFKEEDRLVVNTHAAGMNEQDKMGLVERCYRRYDALEQQDPSAYKNITDRLPFCKVGKKHWKKRIKINKYLMRHLNYQRPIIIRGKFTAGPKTYYPDTGRGVVKYTRNSVEHLSDQQATELSKAEKKKRKRDREAGITVEAKKNFEDVQCYHMIAKSLPGLLCEFCRLLNDEGYLEVCLGNVYYLVIPFVCCI
jgi:hypothetical protein